ncbi:hypothetical protein [Spiroplasma mirum]|uniref:hypothetical protein n=1 Tax=Spiroplasma mirum TaxID=2144 RepID=UPI0004B2870E|nr:hypothetical protein [Spiroplasma atrichopogonis]
MIQKNGDDTGLFGQTIKEQIALVKPNLDSSTAHDDDFFKSDYAVWQDGVKKS